MLFVTEAEVREILTMPECITRMHECFSSLAEGQAENQPRRRLFLPTGTVFHQLPAWWRGYLGMKFYATNVKRGAAHFHMMLYDAATAEPLATFEANALGQIRTGAATGLATAVMAPRDVETAAIIGSGFQAWTQLEAILTVRQPKLVRVFSRSEEKREDFARRAASAFGREVRASPSSEDAVRGAEIVTTATFAKDPVFDAAWLREDCHINAAGSNAGNRREVPTGAVTGAGCIAVDSIEQARIEAGDLLLAVPEAQWASLPIVELQRIVADSFWKRPGGKWTLFKSLGLGVEDVAAAALVYERLKL
jgi:ornithine cyclodeaminase/alanine dehydrogenase-like protein (mu-crystallin family)